MGNLYYEPQLDEVTYKTGRPEEARARELANLEGSIRSYTEGSGASLHDIQIDLDLSHEYRPSTTPGHGHLVIHPRNAQLSWTTADYVELLCLLVRMDIIEPGNLKLLEDHGQTFLRLPEVKKGGTAAVKARVEANKLRTAEVVAQEQREKLLRDLAKLEGMG